jgi:hypothetical protein
MNASRQEVRISVSGNDRDIGDLYGRSDLNVTADLTQTATGDRILALTPQTVSANLPSGIKLDDVQPSQIAVTLEPLIQKDLPVEPAITGQPAAGYEIYSTTVIPARARLSGPESFMATINSVPTAPIDINGAKSDVTAHQIAISINNPRVTLSNSDVVEVTVVIGEKRIERIFTLISGNKHITAMLYGPRSVVTKLKPADLRTEVVKGENGTDVPQLTLPESTRSSVEIRDLKLH